MKFEKTCKVLLRKGTKTRVPCYTYKHKALKRQIAVHENVDNKTKLSVSDLETGLRFFDLDKTIKTVRIQDVEERMEVFLKHFTLEETLKRLEQKEQ